MVVKKTFRYSNVFFLQPLMPQFRHSEHYYGKRYIGVVKKTFRCSNVFFLQPLIPQFRHSEHYYGKRYVGVVKKTLRCSKVFFLQPLMPQFRHSEHYYGKRYKKQYPVQCRAPNIHVQSPGSIHRLYLYAIKFYVSF